MSILKKMMETDNATWFIIITGAIITFVVGLVTGLLTSWPIAAYYYKQSSTNTPDWALPMVAYVELFKNKDLGHITLPLADGDYTLVVEGKTTSTVRQETVRGNGLIIRPNPDDWHIKRVIVIRDDRALELDFSRGKLPRQLRFTRASTGTYHPRLAGGMVVASAGEPRFEEISTGVYALLVEDYRINLLRESDAPASQFVDFLTVGTYTLWVEGRGTATVSGIANGTATDESPLIFKMESEGELKVTVTGELTRFQLEEGTSPSSYIATSTAEVIRASDVISVEPEDVSGR